MSINNSNKNFENLIKKAKILKFLHPTTLVDRHKIHCTEQQKLENV